MFQEIKNRIDKELPAFIASMEKDYSLSSISPLLAKSIKNFLLRKGKRLRPVLFVTGYLGFSGRAAPGLYRSALSMELLHDFMLIHDDIIDKSSTRRGEPSMHALMNSYLKGFGSGIKFSGEDLAIVTGDIIYAMAINAFLCIKEEPSRKEKALKKFVEAAMYTGSGEFIELICGVKNLGEIKKEEIYKVYDFKTAYYSFASPLAIGAILAGASDKQTERLFKYGVCLGRAFQIKDDLLSLFETEEETGKPSLIDLQEGKKTLPLWHAYNHAVKKERRNIELILGKKKVSKPDLLKIRKILRDCGSLDFSRKEVAELIRQAQKYNASSGINREYRLKLDTYCRRLLDL